MDIPESVIRELIQEQDRSKWIARSNHGVKCFTENEIKRMTSNYKTILGSGSFGEVYKGLLEDTSMVAVKKFTDNVKENFAKELIVHREINHKNVVRLIGYCFDENALMMVTEYISKGNLSEILHSDRTPITLDTRLRIAIECADALGYMHSQMYTQVIHGDIKPANILLDDGLGAKVSDFGISRLVNTDNTLYTLNVIGSIGYMDPMFARNGRLTAKSDVYSFGVVLLELITRKKARTKGSEIGLVESFTQAFARGVRRVREMFDSGITTPGNMKTIEEIAKLAGKCLSMKLDKRPEMLEVAVQLRKLQKAIHQVQERLSLFSWGMKSKSEAPANLAPLRESSRSRKLVRIRTPPETTRSSQGSYSSTQKVGIVSSIEAASSREISNTSKNDSIVDPTEMASSHESNSSTRNARIVATNKAVSSQGRNSSAKNVRFVAPSEAASSQKGGSSNQNVRIVAPTEAASSQKSSSSSQNVRIVAPAEMSSSKESIGNNEKMGIVGPIAFRDILIRTEVASLEENSSRIVSVGPIEKSLQLELKDLYQASAHILGTDIFGLTYSLKCLNGPELVVKQRTQHIRGFILPKVEFEERLSSIGAIQSKSIVPLRGYYYSYDTVLLLYDNMPMGSLARALHGDGGCGQARLDWEQRSSISLAVARGVAFIHSFGPSSVHGNISSSNVLLSSTHGACVSDHGMMTLFTGVYWATPSQKSDVYRFGVLLLELLSRKAPLDHRLKGVDLPRWVQLHSIALEKWAVEVFDVELLGQKYNGGVVECMMRLLQLAMNCCSEDANLRPAMCDVVQQIENIRQSN